MNLVEHEERTHNRTGRDIAVPDWKSERSTGIRRNDLVDGRYDDIGSEEDRLRPVTMLHTDSKITAPFPIEPTNVFADSALDLVGDGS